MSRIYNFSAGPSAFPESVLLQAQQEMLEWRDSGMSVMEMSHRGKHFSIIAEALESDLRELLAIPDNYKVLFLQGGASAQFSLIPQNLLNGKSKASYVKTGAWSEKAISDAQAYCELQVSATSEDSKFTTIPAYTDWQIDEQSAYLHYTSNETIHGVEFSDVPDSKGLPLVCDMSSNILSRSIDVSKYGLIYAGAQKNMGPAGVTVVILREDLMGYAPKTVPSVFNYAEQAKNGSMLNTPATYNWYLTGLVLQWLKAQGGVAAIEQRNVTKAAKLYQAIDSSSLYHNPVDVPFRSRMNVPFILANAELDKAFIAAAEANGLFELKGHRSVGGMRASIYNAMSEAGVQALIDFMAEFERTH
ncbi:MAG: 3-phosphoserine/phosphohydroxythreonine transaminase [Methylococcales bacterium]|nr:3-phosphoserine/phosphohydroxythreonine transaminase [Methylococcaceae bacterium]